MSKHRPGPWVLSETSVLRHGDTKETQICEIFCNRNNKLIAEIPDYCYHAEDAEQDKADARLIAAAPELFEALRQITREYRRIRSADMPHEETENIVCVEAALKALAKATA
ncbi:hypothetical protein A9C11_23175 [Pseudomonas citronellolis]|uniref:Uncharacterized protein n=1 Tax=Pseudomonas citronellolis TaxID=53408 RepID=A0A1A9KHT6_9PSED|nr:hypothetical protein [Pseudomonas citronellolis]ANI14448.1 hypothetical protein A9C11_10840 [Pseudomonas citronellolis]ANI16690.1 hypothetical protein A9C11_23175 [Pseudomonas citronellolis]